MQPRETISDLLLEQYVLGELPPRVARRIRSELSRDPALRARYESIARSDREILDRYPPEGMAKTLRERLENEGQAAGEEQDRPEPVRQAGFASTLEPAGRWALQLAVGLPAAAALLIVLSFFFFRGTGSDIRVKGLAPHVGAFLKTAQGARDLAPDTLVHRGDVIQLSYTAGEARYGVILSIDGRGTITWHMPSRFPGESVPAPSLDRQGPVVLPRAYELDDAPGFERFFFIYSDRPFDMTVAAAAARALTARLASADREDLVLPPGIRQTSFLLLKPGHVS